jgi:hypothetical protein
MKRSRLLAGLVTSAALLFSATAHAAIVNVAVGAAGDVGTGMNFDSQPATTGSNAASPFTVGNWTFTTGTNPVEVNIGTSGSGAQPLGTTGNYLSVLGSGSEIVTFAPTTSFSFFWGSIDNFNTLVVDTSQGNETFTGSSIATLFSGEGVQATGCQVQTNCNRYFTFTDGNGGSITGFTMSSSTNSFEITNISAVPEASTWAMMVLGFLGLGFLGYRKSSNTSFRVA